MITVEIGVAGLILLLAAFTLLDTGKLDRSSSWYQLLNMVGAGLLALYAWELKAYVFVVLEVFWAVVAGLELVFNWVKRRQ